MTIFALSAQTPLSTVDAILNEKFRLSFSSLDFKRQRMREDDSVSLRHSEIHSTRGCPPKQQ